MTRTLTRALLVCALAALLHASADAQTETPEQRQQPATSAPPAASQEATARPLEEVLRLLREQRQEIERLRAQLDEQARDLMQLRARVERGEAAAAAAAEARGGASFTGALYRGGETGAAEPARASVTGQGESIEERVGRVEEQLRRTGDTLARTNESLGRQQLGSLAFGGDLRFRYESFYGQQNALASAENPGALGNPLSTRQRLRLRARLSVRGRISEEFDWGLRLASGSFADVGSTNQTLTDFYTRKPFALDQAYLAYRPKFFRNFQLLAGKFDTPWTRTELTWDNDISTEGLAESIKFRDDSLDFRANALAGASGLAARLRDARDPVSQYLQKRLSAETRKQLADYKGDGPLPEPLRRALADELNSATEDVALYEKGGFAQARLPERVRRLLAEDGAPKGDDLRYLNRLLLEAAYQGELPHTHRGSLVRNVFLRAWQLPMLERNSAFVLGADGRVDLSASGRAGRDLALYGAQFETEIVPTKNVILRLSAADLYFSGTQLITPAQFFGANVQFPVTVTIPASGTSPARTVSGLATVPRNLLVSGNSNLGLSVANTNAVNRDGRLSSGFNLVDLIARAEFTHSRRWPVTLLFNFVTNTQTHDVVTAGPGGADLLLPNDQGQGFWAEVRVGKDILRLPVDSVARGDLMFDYTFVRAEKDAVLSPFNGSDLGLSTDMRVHRFVAGYAAHPRVQLTLTGFFAQRPTGLLGAFGQTPPGSLNRTGTRLQFDTNFRF